MFLVLVVRKVLMVYILSSLVFPLTPVSYEYEYDYGIASTSHFLLIGASHSNSGG